MGHAQIRSARERDANCCGEGPRFRGGICICEAAKRAHPAIYDSRAALLRISTQVRGTLSFASPVATIRRVVVQARVWVSAMFFRSHVAGNTQCFFGTTSSEMDRRPSLLGLPVCDPRGSVMQIVVVRAEGFGGKYVFMAPQSGPILRSMMRISPEVRGARSLASRVATIRSLPRKLGAHSGLMRACL